MAKKYVNICYLLLALIYCGYKWGIFGTRQLNSCLTLIITGVNLNESSRVGEGGGYDMTVTRIIEYVKKNITGPKI